MKPARILSLILPSGTANQIVSKSIDQEGLDMLHKAKIELWLQCKDWSDQNVGQAYALIYQTYCNRMMQNRVQEHVSFKLAIWDDPIKLLRAVKILMHDPARVKYTSTHLWQKSMTRVMNLKQYEDENILEYIKHFKQARDVMSANVNTTTTMLDNFITSTAEYKATLAVVAVGNAAPIAADAAAQTVMKTNAYGRWWHTF